MSLKFVTIFKITTCIIFVRSKCYGKYNMAYNVNNYSKNKVGRYAGQNYIDRECKIDVCYDGRRHTVVNFPIVI